jgi:hypothetical protein
LDGPQTLAKYAEQERGEEFPPVLFPRILSILRFSLILGALWKLQSAQNGCFADKSSQSQSKEIGTFWIDSFDGGEDAGSQHGQTKYPAPTCHVVARADERARSRLEFLEASVSNLLGVKTKNPERMAVAFRAGTGGFHKPIIP